MIENHIRPNSQKKCKPYALRLMDLYLSPNNSEKIKDKFISLLDGNEEAFKEFEKWKFGRRLSSVSAENYEFLNKFTLTQNKLNPLSFISFETNNIQKKTIPLTKWLRIPIKSLNYSNIKLKHLNDESFKLSTLIKANSEICFKKLINDQVHWDTIFKSCNPIQNDKDIYADIYKGFQDNSNDKTFILIHKRIIEKNAKEKKLSKICTTLASTSTFQLNQDETLLEMSLSFILKTVQTNKRKNRNSGINNVEDLTKVKIIIKDIKPETKELLKFELNGTQYNFLDTLVSFKNFIEKQKEIF